MNTSGQPRLLLLGHGSSKHPDSSQSVRAHADLLRKRGRFSEVRVAFLKEEPLVRDVLEFVSFGDVRVVPDFLAEGYFTQQVIPGLLKLDSMPESVSYCQPVGSHPMMQELIAEAADGLLGGWKKEDVSLILVGHGSTKNTRSKESLLKHIEGLRQSSSFGQVADLWLEESPFVSEWESVATWSKVIVVPFLLNDGQHGGWDIPDLLGVNDDTSVHGVTHELGRCQVRVAPALGTSDRFSEVIEQVALV